MMFGNPKKPDLFRSSEQRFHQNFSVSAAERFSGTFGGTDCAVTPAPKPIMGIISLLLSTINPVHPKSKNNNIIYCVFPFIKGHCMNKNPYNLL